MREMVSELLGEEGQSSLSGLYPNPWPRLAEGCGAWAQTLSETMPSQGESEVGSHAEQLPACAPELQSSMALLGVYPYNTLLPQGSCLWDWSPEYAQPVSKCVCVCERETERETSSCSIVVCWRRE